MALKFSPSKPVFENLVKHLVNIEEQKSILIDEFFPVSSPERKKMEELFDTYINQIESLIKNAQIAKTGNNCLPFVIIGSEVGVENLETGDTYQLQIVSPLEESTNADETKNASCLSPVGKALLLRKIGDKVVVKVPAGEYHYHIKSIALPDL